MAIVFEGPDGVGKTTLAKRMGGEQDRSWLTCMIYRFGMPKRNWDDFSLQWPKASANDDLVVITYDYDNTPDDLEAYANVHGYNRYELAWVNHLYNKYVKDELDGNQTSFLWRSITHFSVNLKTRKYTLLDHSPCYMCTEEEIRELQKLVWTIQSCMTQS